MKSFEGNTRAQRTLMNDLPVLSGGLRVIYPNGCSGIQYTSEDDTHNITPKTLAVRRNYIHLNLRDHLV